MQTLRFTIPRAATYTDIRKATAYTAAKADLQDPAHGLRIAAQPAEAEILDLFWDEATSALIDTLERHRLTNPSTPPTGAGDGRDFSIELRLASQQDPDLRDTIRRDLQLFLIHYIAARFIALTDPDRAKPDQQTAATALATIISKLAWRGRPRRPNTHP